jgi:hypothetical protein
MASKFSSLPDGARIDFRKMADAPNRGGAFTTVDGALSSRGQTARDFVRDLRDGLDVTFYSAGDEEMVNVSEWRLAHDALDKRREVGRATASAREVA